MTIGPDDVLYLSEPDIMKMKVVELKAACTERHQLTTGNKAHLRHRLLRLCRHIPWATPPPPGGTRAERAAGSFHAPGHLRRTPHRLQSHRHVPQHRRHLVRCRLHGTRTSRTRLRHGNLRLFDRSGAATTTMANDLARGCADLALSRPATPECALESTARPFLPAINLS